MMSKTPRKGTPEQTRELRSHPADDSPSHSDGGASANCASTSSHSTTLSPRPPPAPACIIPPLRPGTIVKGVRGRRSPLVSNPKANSGSSYTLRERTGPTQGGKWCFIVNGLKLSLWEAYCPPLLKQLNAVEHKIYITRAKGHARGLAEKAARSGCNLIAAVGGNGTLNEVIDGVLRAGVVGPDGLPVATVAVLPLGIASDFHRSMAWEPTARKHSFEDAMWRLGHRGETAVLDVGRIVCDSPDGVVERHFINVASCGASARAAMQIPKWKWFGESGRYRMATIAALLKYRSRSLGIRIDGGEWKKLRDVSLLAIGNGGYFCHGINICPDANPFDGKLQMVSASGMGPLSFITNRWKLKMGQHLDFKGVRSANVTRRIDVALWHRRGPTFRLPSSVASPMRSGMSMTSSESSASTDQSTLDGISFSSGTSPGVITPNGSFCNLEAPLRTHSPPTSADSMKIALDMAKLSSTDEGPSASSSSELSTPSTIRRQEIDVRGRGKCAENGVEAGPTEDRKNSKASTGKHSESRRGSTKRNGSKGKAHKYKEEDINAEDFGPVPVEVDGEVVGFAPFSISIIPGAIKFRVLGTKTI